MTTVYYVLGVLVLVLGVGLSIALHELGHLVPAKRFGVKCTQYMIGFGPTLWSRTIGDTQYGIKAIPIGGYVRMIGMIPPRPGDTPGRLRPSTTGRMSALAEQARAESMEEIGPGDADRVFYKLSVPRKVTVMLGGPLMNLALGALLLTVLMVGIGREQLVPTLSRVTDCVPTAAPTRDRPLADCVPGDPVAPARTAGLVPGDTIVEVGGRPVRLWAEVTTAIRAAGPGGQLALVVERSGTRIPLTVTLAPVTRAVTTPDNKATVRPDGTLVSETIGFLGASPSAGFVRQSITEVPAELGSVLGSTLRVIGSVPEKLVGVWRAVTGQADRDPDGLVSVVGVARVGGEIASGQFGEESPRSLASKFIALLFGLNLALFLFNLIPLLPLDGGQVVGALWEGVKRTWARLRGRPDPGYVDVARGLPLAYAVSMLLIGMTLLLVYADLFAPIRLG